MTNQEILKKAFRKALQSNEDLEVIGMYDEIGDIIPEVLIFNHDFAKALWGEELVLYTPFHGKGICESPKYIIHLMGIVIADNPIAYLGANL